MEFNIGDRVKMSIKGMARFSNEHSNPHGTEGTIRSIGNFPLNISVNWDNGDHNTYDREHLILIESVKEIKESKPMNELDKQIQYMELMTEKKEEKGKYSYKEFEVELSIKPTYKSSSIIVDEGDEYFKKVLKDKVKDLGPKHSTDTLGQLKKRSRTVGYADFRRK